MEISSSFWKALLSVLILLPGTSSAAESVANDCAARLPLTQAWRSGALPPDLDQPQAPASLVELPDTLQRSHLGGNLRLHYRLELLPCPQERVLLIPRAGAAYALHVDGQHTQTLAPLLAMPDMPDDSDILHNPRIPALFRIPPGAHILDIDLRGQAFLNYGLPALSVGTLAALSPVHASLYRHIIEWTLNVGQLITILGALGVWVWTQRRHDQGLKWFLIASAVWILRGHYAAIPSLPLPPNLYEFGISLQVALMAPTTVAATLHILRRWGNHWGRWLWGSMVACVLLLGAGLLLPPLAHTTRSVVYAITFAWMATACGLTMRHRRTLAGWRGSLVVVGYLCMLLGIGVDYLHVQGVLAFGVTTISWLVWGYMALLLSLLVVLTDHALHAVDRIHRLNTELDQRVRERTKEIATLYTQREAEQLARAENLARQQERERLVREIHDGIGGQLTTTLRAVERGRFTPQGLGQSLQECLDDLRLVMDASSSHERLDTALASWRHRWDTRLELLGVTLHWQVQDPLEDGLGTHAVLQVLRVLQEAVTNALKHAQASRIEVHTTLETTLQSTTQLRLQVRDNGCGTRAQTTDEPGAGRGLLSMRQRARELGGTLHIDSSPGQGTVIDLQVPLPQLSAPDLAAQPPR